MTRFQRLKKDFIKETLDKLSVKILAQKRENTYIILFMRVDYIDSSNKVGVNVHYSIEKQSLIIEEILSEKNFEEKIILDSEKILYKFKEERLEFIKKPEFFTNDKEWKNLLSTNHQKYYNFKEDRKVLLIFKKKLYNIEKVRDDFTNLDTLEHFQHVKNFNKGVFFKKGKIITGQDLINLYFKDNDQFSPILLFILPINSFEINFNFNLVERFWFNDLINLSVQWSIPAILYNDINFIYIIDDKRIEINEFNFSLEIDYQRLNSLDFIIFWRGSEEFLPKDTKFFIHSFYFYRTEENREEVKLLENDIEKIQKSLQNTSSLDDKIKKFKVLSEKFRLLDINPKWLYSKLKGIDPKAKQIESYRNYIKALEKKYERTNIDFQRYLFLNNLLYEEYEKNVDEIIKRYHQRTSGVIFGETLIPELNELLFNLDKAVSNITFQIRKAYRDGDKFELINLFEILGDLYIHFTLLKLLSPETVSNKHFSSYFQTKNALESYLKAITYYEERNIPGIGRMSIRVDNYMKVFNKFMKNYDLKGKKDYIEGLISEEHPTTQTKKETKRSFIQLPRRTQSPKNQQVSLTDDSIIPPVVREILNDIREEYEKLEKTHDDLITFVSQTQNPKIQLALAIILKRVYLRTTTEVAQDLEDKILNLVGTPLLNIICNF